MQGDAPRKSDHEELGDGVDGFALFVVTSWSHTAPHYNE